MVNIMMIVKHTYSGNIQFVYNNSC